MDLPLDFTIDIQKRKHTKANKNEIINRIIKET